MPKSSTTNPSDVITNVYARWVLDSRANPTIEVEVYSKSGEIGQAIVPSGASTGTYEALELRDGNKSKFHGKGVKKAINNINVKIRQAIKGQSPFDQNALDEILLEADGTPNKSNLGGNAILGVSLATAHLAAKIKKIPLYEWIRECATTSSNQWILPVPMANVINGGVHAGNQLAIQEFMILPIGANDFREAVRMISEVYHTLKQLLKDKYGKDAVNVGDEGGFAPPVETTEKAMEALVRAIEESGYGLKTDFYLGVDAAANEFQVAPNKYSIDGKAFTSQELIDYYVNLVRMFPLISIEDPFHEDDFGSFSSLVKKVGNRVQIVGDDLTVTNPTRIQRALDENAMTALLLKVNQIGTLSEAIKAANMCLQNQPKGKGVIVSHRSGETEDTTISHLVVGLSAGQIKTGAPARGERTAKYNELIRISDRLDDKAVYAGINFQTPWKIQ